MFIKMQLAEQYVNYPYKKNLFKGNHIVEPKIDGLRGELTAEGCFSRNGNRWGFNSAQIEKLTNFLSQININIDGEWDCLEYDRQGNLLNHYDRRRLTMSYVKVKSITRLDKIVFWVFDAIPVQGNLPLKDRKKLLEQLIPMLQMVCPFQVKVLPYKVVRSEAEFMNIFREFVDDGFEGVMLKNLNALYKIDCRTPDWLKLKWRYTSDLPIIRIEFGKAGKKNADRMGVVVVKTPWGEAEIGTGFPETGKESRQWFKERMNDVAGLVMEVEHEGYANKEGNLLNASYKCIRWDKKRWEMSF